MSSESIRDCDKVFEPVDMSLGRGVCVAWLEGNWLFDNGKNRLPRNLEEFKALLMKEQGFTTEDQLEDFLDNNGGEHLSLDAMFRKFKESMAREYADENSMAGLIAPIYDHLIPYRADVFTPGVQYYGPDGVDSKGKHYHDVTRIEWSFYQRYMWPDNIVMARRCHKEVMKSLKYVSIVSYNHRQHVVGNFAGGTGEKVPVDFKFRKYEDAQEFLEIVNTAPEEVSGVDAYCGEVGPLLYGRHGWQFSVEYSPDMWDNKRKLERFARQIKKSVGADRFNIDHDEKNMKNHNVVLTFIFLERKFGKKQALEQYNRADALRNVFASRVKYKTKEG